MITQKQYNEMLDSFNDEDWKNILFGVIRMVKIYEVAYSEHTVHHKRFEAMRLRMKPSLWHPKMWRNIFGT
jgi:hypothetical protein